MSGPLVRLRAAWARSEFIGLRAAVGRAIEATPLVRGRRVEGGVRRVDGAEALVLTGRFSVDPMSGRVFADGRPLDPGWALPAPSDWLVRAFPSRMSLPVVAPLWFGGRADTVAILAEALPRRIALDRLERGAVGLVSAALGRLDRMQEALGAGVFAPGAIKVQPWDKLIEAPRALWPRPTPPVAADLREAGRRLRAAFGARGEGAPIMLVAGGEARAARLWPDWREVLSREGAVLVDPERTSLAALIPALSGAARLIAPSSGEGALALVCEGEGELWERRSERPDDRARAVAKVLGWQVRSEASGP